MLTIIIIIFIIFIIVIIIIITATTTTTATNNTTTNTATTNFSDGEVDERLDVLLHVKWTVKDQHYHDCYNYYYY